MSIQRRIKRRRIQHQSTKRSCRVVEKSTCTSWFRCCFIFVCEDLSASRHAEKERTASYRSIDVSTVTLWLVSRLQIVPRGQKTHEAAGEDAGGTGGGASGKREEIDTCGEGRRGTVRRTGKRKREREDDNRLEGRDGWLSFGRRMHHRLCHLTRVIERDAVERSSFAASRATACERSRTRRPMINTA